MTRFACGRRRTSLGPRSVMRSSTTTRTWLGSSWLLTPPRSPTGSCAETSNVSDTFMTTLHDVINPATEDVVTTVEQTDAAGADAAVERAALAFETWRSVEPADRARLLRRFAAVI